MSKPDPDRVVASLARAALLESKHRAETYTHYIIRHYRASGRLAPGCDFKDLIAWYETNMPDELAAITRKTT